MLIALIDDGINTATCPEVVLQYDLTVDEKGTVTKRDVHDALFTDHGTTCAKIIAKYAPKAAFCSLRIFDAFTYGSLSHKPELHTSCDRLAAALEWCCNAKVPIVHISAGTSLLSDRAKIRPIVAKMLRQRQIVIAAHSNRGEASIPACLGGVLGVAADKAMRDDAYKIACGENGFHKIVASSKHTLSFPHGIEATTQLSNSYAAPTVTVAVHNALLAYGPHTLSAPQVIDLLAKGTVTPRWAAPDFMEAAYFVNPGGDKILKNHLFFKCMGEFASLADWKKNAEWKHDLVYLPAKAENAVEALMFLKENASAYEGLLFGGSPPREMEALGRTTMVWGEFKGFDYGSQGLNAPSNTGCPTITIRGDAIDTLDLICRLRELFILDGYECACLSDALYAYLYGVEHVSSDIDGAQILKHIKRRYQPDVVLCGISAKDLRPVHSSEKCVVSLSSDEIDGELARWYIPNKLDEEDVLEIFYNGFKEFFE